MKKFPVIVLFASILDAVVGLAGQTVVQFVDLARDTTGSNTGALTDKDGTIVEGFYMKQAHDAWEENKDPAVPLIFVVFGRPSEVAWKLLSGDIFLLQPESREFSYRFTVNGKEVKFTDKTPKPAEFEGCLINFEAVEVEWLKAWGQWFEDQKRGGFRYPEAFKERYKRGVKAAYEERYPRIVWQW